MIREIVTWPSKSLIRKADNVCKEDDFSIIEDLIDTLVSCNALGISAPQIGVSKRVCVIHEKKLSLIDKRDSESEFIVLINPEIVDGMGDLVFQEGCNSVPGHTATVPRAMMSIVKYTCTDNKEIERCFTGMTSAVVQHEIDHLDGITIADRQNAQARAEMVHDLDS
jgi:peptide deformylase